MLYKIKGDFFDCQLYKDFLYIWDMDGVLSLYDWNAIKETIGLVAGNRANYNVYGNIKAFQRFRKGFPVEVVGGLFPTDTPLLVVIFIQLLKLDYTRVRLLLIHTEGRSFLQVVSRQKSGTALLCH